MSDTSRVRRVLNAILATGLLWIFKAKLAVQARMHRGREGGTSTTDEARE